MDEFLDTAVVRDPLVRRVAVVTRRRGRRTLGPRRSATTRRRLPLRGLSAAPRRPSTALAMRRSTPALAARSPWSASGPMAASVGVSSASDTTTPSKESCCRSMPITLLEITAGTSSNAEYTALDIITRSAPAVTPAENGIRSTDVNSSALAATTAGAESVVVCTEPRPGKCFNVAAAPPA